ncbi:hypothetical protein [Salinispora vitiensis]|uniref:hypothetical protein n=1 Tax=Salinispora vitiensis TaxID=999544 RepID=UPI0003617D2A
MSGRVNGAARVFEDGQLHLYVVNLPDVSGYYEVWLISVVDISAERYDNNTDHSGDSLVRGTLTG